ncbi:hypothetical protein KUTeg_024617 [Tegillarca granosa]|uniref:Uncharacterized protein n=1 Tax=Tegillarca granosa TaxID=220873 RepID=A0ABQ9DXV1_TEGGR|nr:hypothetical protein KUTeg_024617 [Tegillarca granosa]
MSILDTIYWIAKSRSAVEESTIVKCFNKCGFMVNTYALSHVSDDNKEENDDNEDDDNVPLSVLKMSRELFDRDFRELIAIDFQAKTCYETTTDWCKPVSELLNKDDHIEDENEDDQIDEHEQEKIISISESQHMILKLRKFAIKSEKTSILNKVMEINDELL